MSPGRSRRGGRAGEPPVELPDGVGPTDWALEKFRAQNPRIRCLLGGIRKIEPILDSNYTLLHCSPQRLQEIWRQVRELAHYIVVEVAPLLRNDSPIPQLETTRRNTQLSLNILSQTVLSDIERYPEEVPEERHREVRKLLCVAIGQMNAFLRDTFSEFMAGDPRSQWDADYYLSKRFPRDIEESEWLQAGVRRLQAFLRGLTQERSAVLRELARELAREQTVPTAGRWRPVEVLLRELRDGLPTKLKEVLSSPGIRFDELEVIDRFSFDVPLLCAQLLDTYEDARRVSDALRQGAAETRPEQEQRIRDLVLCHAYYSRKMAHLATRIEGSLHDMLAFVPLWLENLEKRRALLLAKGLEGRRVPEEGPTLPGGEAGNPGRR